MSHLVTSDCIFKPPVPSSSLPPLRNTQIQSNSDGKTGILLFSTGFFLEAENLLLFALSLNDPETEPGFFCFLRPPLQRSLPFPSLFPTPYSLCLGRLEMIAWKLWVCTLSLLKGFCPAVRVCIKCCILSCLSPSLPSSFPLSFFHKRPCFPTSQSFSENKLFTSVLVVFKYWHLSILEK